MHVTVIIPHYKTGKMTAYSIAQWLKHKGKHELDIVIVDNNAGDGSIEYLNPFLEHITILSYPKDKLQSHGIAIDYAVPHIRTEYFITAESDSFPESEVYLDYMEKLTHDGVDAAGSRLQLSGGTYLHPCGALYKKAAWQECKKYCEEMPYLYFPNMAMKNGFACHLMVHESIAVPFFENPEDYIELSDSYKPYSIKLAEERREYYSPTVAPFHNGMNGRQESVHTYGFRTIETESPHTIYNDRWQKLILKIGAEPGQFISWWMAATNKKVIEINTEVKWLPNKENQQQEYTLMAIDFRHLWGVSAYHDHTPDAERDVALFKQSLPEMLYESLPNNQKINQ